MAAGDLKIAGFGRELEQRPQPFSAVNSPHLLGSLLTAWMLFMASGCVSLDSSVGAMEPTPTRDTVATLCCDPPAPVLGPRMEQRAYGYYVWWTRGLWLHLDLSVWDKIFFFSVTPDEHGDLVERNGWPYAWQGLLAKADSANVPVVPTLALLDADVIKQLFSDSTARSNLVATSLGLIEESGGAGLHVDVELFDVASDSLKAGFKAFADTLAVRVDSLYPTAELSMLV